MISWFFLPETSHLHCHLICTSQLELGMTFTFCTFSWHDILRNSSTAFYRASATTQVPPVSSTLLIDLSAAQNVAAVQPELYSPGTLDSSHCGTRYFPPDSQGFSSPAWSAFLFFHLLSVSHSFQYRPHPRLSLSLSRVFHLLPKIRAFTLAFNFMLICWFSLLIYWFFGLVDHGLS